MTTDKQKEANKRNAQRSTGPKTAEGKRKSRLNAVKHGLTGNTVVINDEDPAAFDMLRQQLMEEYHPRTIIERELVMKLAAQIWRLRRIPVFESAIFESYEAELSWADRALDQAALTNCWKKVADGLVKQAEKENSSLPIDNIDRMAIDKYKQQMAAYEKTQTPDAKLGRMLVLQYQGLEALGKLSRYEVTLTRELERILDRLEYEQAKHKKTIDRQQNRSELLPAANTA